MLRLKRIPQITDSHCGPAVIQMLLARLSFEYTQDQITAAAKAKSRLQRYGTRPDHLAVGVARLTPEYRLYYKNKANLTDLVTLVKKYKIPAAVNWQGLFYATEAEEKAHNPHGDHGHYSIVVDINPEKDQIVMVDPYSEFIGKPRKFAYSWFRRRWWDNDIETDPKTKAKISFKTKRLLFVVLPKFSSIPKDTGLLTSDSLKSLFVTSDYV